MAQIVDKMIARYGIENIPAILDKIKSFGFQYATRSGITWGIDNVVIPKQKEAIVKASLAKSDEVQKQFNEGLLSEDERYRKNIEIWTAAKAEVEKCIPDLWKKTDRSATCLNPVPEVQFLKLLKWPE